jgi:uncharacterized membrane protein YkvA (DUF1232 family)
MNLNDKKQLQFYERLRKQVDHWAKGKPGHQAVDLLLLLPDFFILLTRLFGDARVPTKTKIFIGSVITYLVLPLDIIPDFIPIVGHVDDLVLVAYALRFIMNDIGQDILLEHWSGKRNMLEAVQNIIHVADKLVNHKVLRKITDWISNKGSER